MWLRQIFAVAMAWSLQQTAGSGGEGSGTPRHCTRDWATPLEPDMSLRTPSPDAPGVQPRKLRMDNTCAEDVIVKWVNEHGAEVQVKRLEPGMRLATATTGGAVFRAYFVDDNDQPVQLALEHKVSRLDPRMRHVDIAPCGPEATRFEVEGATVKIEKPKRGDTEPDIVARELRQQNRVEDPLPVDNEDDDTVVVFSVLGGVAVMFSFIALSAVLPGLARGESSTRHQKRLAAARLSAPLARYPNLKPEESEADESSDESDASASSSSEEQSDDEVVVVQPQQLEQAGAVCGGATPSRPWVVQGHVRATVSPTSSVQQLRQKLDELGARDRRLAQLIRKDGVGTVACMANGA